MNARKRALRRRRQFILKMAVFGVLIALVIIGLIVIAGKSREAENESGKTVTEIPTPTGAVSKPTETPAPSPEPTATETPMPTPTPTPIPEGAVTEFSLYKNDKANARRIRYAETYESTWKYYSGDNHPKSDITSFEAIASVAAEIPTKGRYFQDLWRAEWERFSDAWSYRIGYRVTFDLVTGEHIDKMLLKPGDELSYREYLENYLYDDIHQVRGKWYNHLLPDDKIDQMILSSCKFTAGEKIDQVKDRITVTAFVYRGDDDFDEDGNYIGPLSYTVTMINKK
ncbi:MAG: hypothetical protein J5532_03920 [Lachnospiraceae bacterium]|nr:hypothetical protein [Lachnospiraceae bacterium]